MEEPMVDVIEILMPVKNGGEAYNFHKKQKLKLIALLANGIPIKLEKDFILERRYMPKIELDKQLIKHP